MAGMVMMGEYTDGCICAVPGREAQVMESTAGVVGGLVAVITQQRRASDSEHHAD